ncbi:MAG: hypothetical protein LAP40_22160 [Acidobacteriia bacterium]|nr:hypothetical protein [Terriglobia bacterium]
MATASRLAALFLCGGAAMAQQVVGARAGTISFTTGAVFVDGQPARATPVKFPSLNEGQVLGTDRGRAEVLLAPEVFLRLGSQSAMRLVRAPLDDTQVELERGAALVEVLETFKGGRIQIQVGESRTEFKGPGLYRFDGNSGVLRVFGGEAEVQTGDQKARAGRGRQIQLAGPPATAKFNPKKVDALHRWAAARSFYLFASSVQARERQSHWEFTQTGWFWNRNYDLKFFSRPAAVWYSQMLARKAREQAEFEESKEGLLIETAGTVRLEPRAWTER